MTRKSSTLDEPDKVVQRHNYGKVHEIFNNCCTAKFENRSIFM